MSNRISHPQAPALQALYQGVVDVHKEAKTSSESAGQRDLQVEAEALHRTSFKQPLAWIGRAAKIGASHVQLATARQEDIDAAEKTMQASSEILNPLHSLVDGLFDTSNILDVPEDKLSREYPRLMSLSASVDRLQMALDAAGPDVVRDLPMAQLGAIKSDLKEAMATTKGRIQAVQAREEAAKEAAEAQAKLKAELKPDLAQARRDRREALLGGGIDLTRRPRADTEFRREPRVPDPILDATHLTTSNVKTPEAAAKHLAKLLQDPGIEALALNALAEVKGATKTSVSNNLKSFAVLADYATHSLDYRNVRVGMGAPKCRRSHQARDYRPSEVQTSQPRQQASRESLAAGLKAALGADKPGVALKDALVSSFIHEVGINPAAIKTKWKPSIVAIRKALDEEAFVPLRALNEGLNPYRYEGGALTEMREAVVKITQAVVEGKLDDWKNSSPASAKQLSHISEQAQQAWLSTPKVTSTGPGGEKFTTQEASGNELFWATKVGGPSHAFDTMNQCVLSLLGNARTRAITLTDATWHNYAARAYLRLLPREDGPPLLYLEPLQTDFPYREHRRGAACSLEVPKAMLTHALSKAKEMGLGLAMARGYERSADGMGVAHDFDEHSFVLEPSAVTVEASDTLGQHDWQQDTREVINRPFSTISAQELAKLEF